MNILKQSIALLLCSLSLTLAQAASIPVPTAPKLAASSYLLMDYDSAELLVEHNVDERIAPASITKIMTAYVVYKALADGHIGQEDEVLISEKAWRMGGSRTFIEVNKRVKVGDLLMGMIVQSGNDASVALAEHVAGSESAFANMMNAEAQGMGLKNTQYMNTTGLPHPEHYSSARDIALLAQALIRDFPDQYHRYSIRKFTFNGITQYNRNKLLWRDESVDGLKTGYTETAGYCLASSAKRDTMRLISVVMGTDGPNSRVSYSQSLLNYGFRFFETHKLYSAGEALTEARIWQGEIENLPLGLAEDLYITIPRGQYQALAASMDLEQAIDAPVSLGTAYGKVSVAINDENIRQQPLIALRSIPEGGLWRRTVDTVLQWLE
ncbi:MAG: D-alanyl-D-alanine carboxypeptidase [Gammaproteobacteria bacterium]|nr:D-alanyl-D-alanine carboxypeptidase [Gammaproteobacteria bacterium]